MTIPAAPETPNSDFFGSRRSFKHYANYMRFIATVKDGKRAIVLGPDYVVLSRNAYDELVEKANRR